MPDVVVSFKVDEGAFVTLIGQGGEANKYVVRKMREMEVTATILAPVGAPRIGTAHPIGNLKHSHGRTGVFMRGKLRAVGSLYNSAGYALYVHEGVTGKIYPQGRGFSIPKSSFYYYTGNPTISRRGGGVDTRGPIGLRGTFLVWKNPVRGQSANPWIERAVEIVMRGV